MCVIIMDQQHLVFVNLQALCGSRKSFFILIYTDDPSVSPEAFGNPEAVPAAAYGSVNINPVIFDIQVSDYLVRKDGFMSKFHRITLFRSVL